MSSIALRLRRSPRRLVECARGARPLLLDPLLGSLAVFVVLLWMLAFFGLDCSDSLDQWRDIKAAVLAPLIGPLNLVQMLTVANVAWIVLFGMRGWQAWRSRPRPHVAGIVVAISGMVLGGQLQVMTVLLERAAQRFDADVIPSDAELIARLEESRERFDSWVPILRDFEGWWPERGIAPFEWPYAFEQGGEVNDRLRIYQYPLMKHDYAAAEDGLFPRRGWLVQDEGRRIHLAHDLRGIKPYFLIKGLYHGPRPQPLRESLDDIGEGPPGFKAYRHVDGDWYLFVLRTPVRP